MRAPSRVISFLLLTVMTAPAAPRWADAHGFFEGETVRETQLQPGLRWISACGRHQGRPIESQLLAIDLNQADLDLEALTGSRILSPASGQFVWRSTVSQLLADHQALGAINVAFFDIGTTQASQGLVMHGGRLLREPQAGRPSLLVFDDKRLGIGDLRWEARIRTGAQSRPLAGVNRPQLAADEVVAYQLPWSRSPGKNAPFSKNALAREILVGPLRFEPATATGEPARLGGPIVEIRDDGQSMKLKKNQMVLSAGKSAAPFFRNSKSGDEVFIEWKLDGLPEGKGREFHQLREAVSAQPVLIRNGEKLPGGGAFWETRHPRSALGIHPDGRQLLLLVVDGRSEASAGMGLASLSDYLLHLGAAEALNLDGGGSSALAVRMDGKTRILNTPSDGRERSVPTGLGVFAIPAKGP